MQIIETTCAREMLTMEDKLALLLAALCHDVDHDGYSNSYHVNTQVGMVNMATNV